jgi:multiple sugar transport system permease protein
MKTQENIAGYLILLPALIPFLIFQIIPILASLGLAFTKYDLLTPPAWNNFENFTRLFTDERLRITYGNTLIITIGATFLNNLLGLLLALGVNRPMHKIIQYLLRTCYFFPVITTTASMALIWGFLLTKDRGVLNWILAQFGIGSVPWIASSQWVKFSIIIYDVWKSCGYLMVIYLAGLQGVPEVLIDAAKIDGANSFQLTRYIRLPLISPTMFFCIIISLIGAFQIFDNAYVLTAGGPGDASRTIAMYIYEIAFRRREMGFGAAISLSLMVILVVLTLLQFWISRKWVHYE